MKNGTPASFADSMARGPLDDRTRALTLLLAALVRDVTEGERALRAAKDSAASREEVLEIVLQAYLFAGFPRCINALWSYREIFGDDVGAAAPRTSAAAELTSRRAAGEALFRRIYAANADRVLEDLDRYHSDLRDWILTDAYGKVLARPALDARTRELAAVAALMVSGDLRQLSSHMRGAVHCGATAGEVGDVVELIAPFVSSATVESARETAAATRRRFDPSDPS